MYNLLSDKLDRFEREMRKVRNQIVGRSVHGLFWGVRWVFLAFKKYIHTDYVRAFRDIIRSIDDDIEAEFDLRKKIQANDKNIDLVLRDSSIMSSETLKKIKEKA
jgi:hypothetical protein